MLQLQYLNSKLNNKHINKILDNYKLKYSGIKNEIESKINDMIKLFLKDILGFLENVEETADKKKKLNNYEKMKNELEKIRYELKMKTYNEHKIKNELDLLNQENSLLKVKIKSLNEKILNLTNNLNNTSTNTKIPFIRRTVINTHLMSPNLNVRRMHYSTKAITKYSHKNSSTLEKKVLEKEKEKEKDNWIISNDSKETNKSYILPKKEKSNLKKKKMRTERNSQDNLKFSIYLKTTSGTITKKNKKKNYSKFVNNKTNTNKLNNINTLSNKNKKNNNKQKEDSEYIQYSPSPLSSAYSKLVKQNKRNSSSKSNNSNPKKKDSHNYSPDNSFDILNEIPDYEEIENNINSIFDEELKNLEQDEENIKRLLETLNVLNDLNDGNDGNFNDVVFSKNSGESKFSNSD